VLDQHVCALGWLIRREGRHRGRDLRRPHPNAVSGAQDWAQLNVFGEPSLVARVVEHGRRATHGAEVEGCRSSERTRARTLASPARPAWTSSTPWLYQALMRHGVRPKSMYLIVTCVLASALADFIGDARRVSDPRPDNLRKPNLAPTGREGRTVTAEDGSNPYQRVYHLSEVEYDSQERLSISPTPAGPRSSTCAYAQRIVDAFKGHAVGAASRGHQHCRPQAGRPAQEGRGHVAAVHQPDRGERRRSTCAAHRRDPQSRRRGLGPRRGTDYSVSEQLAQSLDNVTLIGNATTPIVTMKRTFGGVLCRVRRRDVDLERY
jgi:hypothetical protein